MPLNWAFFGTPCDRASPCQGQSFWHGDSLESLWYKGPLVGFFTFGDLGFVPLATAADPVAMDELLKGVDEPLTSDEAKELFEEVHGSSNGG